MKWGVRRGANKQTTVKSAKAKYKKDYKEFSKASSKYGNTWIGKDRRAAASKNYDDKLAKVRQSEGEYKQTYKKAKGDAATKMYTEKGYDKGAVQLVSNMSTGKALSQTFLMGSYGALKYNEAKAQGVTTGKAAVNAVFKNWSNEMSYGAKALTEQRSRRVEQMQSQEK